MIDYKLQLMLDKKRATTFFKERKVLILMGDDDSDVKDLFISPHFIDRVAERRLINDIGYMSNMIQYFMSTIFYGTTQVNKSFTLKIRNLRVGVSVVDNHYVTQHRSCIVKTVFDKDEDEKGWFSEETIELKAVSSKNNQVSYTEV